MKDQSVWLQDIHENQLHQTNYYEQKQLWHIFFFTSSSEVDNFRRFPFVCYVNGRAMHSGSSAVGSKSSAAHWPLRVCIKLRSNLFYSNFRCQTPSLWASQPCEQTKPVLPLYIHLSSQKESVKLSFAPLDEQGLPFLGTQIPKHYIGLLPSPTVYRCAPHI